MINSSARVALLAAAIALPLTGLATDPESGTLTDGTTELTFTSGPSIVSNGGDCSLGGCDDYRLTVSLPNGYVAANPGSKIDIVLPSPTPADDYDMQLLLASDESLQATSGNSPGETEQISVVAQDGTIEYIVRIVPFAVIGNTATVTITLGSEPVPEFPQATGLAPRYKNHESPPDLGNTSGEPTLGYNPLTGRVMFISLFQALRVTFQENETPALPEACDAVWEDKSGTITTLNSLDPLMTTDQETGRTFNSQLAGANSLFEFSDDDGETWTPGQIGPPNGGADHQGMIPGPYPDGFRPPSATYPNAFYYCSQSVASAFCSRSDDGGLTFGPGFPFKNAECVAGGLHGHPKVAPDGTLYVPDSTQCVARTTGQNEIVAHVSEDAGATFQVRPIPGSLGGTDAASDPSIGIATDGTVYMCYEDANSQTLMAVSRDKGVTWDEPVNLSVGANLVYTRFPAAIAGDSDRAACAFLGTTTAEGDPNDLSFEGIWHGYIATTYDGGQTYHLVNVTPNDPVQGFGGVGPDGTNRNLLDFNDLEIDEFGRTLFSYADGCIGGCISDPSANGFADKGNIIRQTGGRTLFAEFDDAAGTQFNTTTLLAPRAACAVQNESIRTNLRTEVVWRAPDNGGDPVTNYEVFRSESANGPFVKVGDAGPRRSFMDTSADPNVENYYYQVVAQNNQGSAPVSNTIELPITVEDVVDTCTLPGEIIAVDTVGDGMADDTDFEFIAAAEPPGLDGNLAITMKVVNFASGQPPASSFYPVLFPTQNNLYVSLDATQGAPRFTFGRFEDLQSGVLAFTEEGSLDDASAFAGDGTITLVVPKTLFSNGDVGATIAGFDGRSRIGAQSASSRDTVGPGDYELRGTASCLDPGALLATLGADRNSGQAPFTVNFTIGGQPADGETLETYNIDFGDGQSLRDQPFNGQSTVQVTHTYRADGTFPARATVIDSSGAESTNRAEQFIEVGTGLPGSAPTAGGRSGGTLPLGLLMILLSAAVLRRRH